MANCKGWQPWVPVALTFLPNWTFLLCHLWKSFTFGSPCQIHDNSCTNSFLSFLNSDVSAKVQTYYHCPRQTPMGTRTLPETVQHYIGMKFHSSLIWLAILYAGCSFVLWAHINAGSSYRHVCVYIYIYIMPRGLIWDILLVYRYIN